MKTQTNVRVSDETRQQLEALRLQTGRSIGQVVETAVDRYWSQTLGMYVTVPEDGQEDESDS